MSEQQTPTPTIPEPDRPQMPKGYGLAADREGMLTWEWVEEQLTRSRNYWICTARPDGRPHAMPVWGLWMDGRFYFSTGAGTVKARNLAATPAITVHLESGDDVVVIEGVAEMESEPAVLARFADRYDAKYSFRPDVTNADGYYVVRPRTVIAMQEQAFVSSATRWRFA